MQKPGGRIEILILEKTFFLRILNLAILLVHDEHFLQNVFRTLIMLMIRNILEKDISAISCVINAKSPKKLWKFFVKFYTLFCLREISQTLFSIWPYQPKRFFTTWALLFSKNYHPFMVIFHDSLILIMNNLLRYSWSHTIRTIQYTYGLNQQIQAHTIATQLMCNVPPM
jgi:hypothetical protein